MMSAGEIERWRAAPLTYTEVGATAGELPPGYHHLRRSAPIGAGTEVWSGAADAVRAWALQDDAGLRPVVSDSSVVLGSVGVLRIGMGPLSLRAPLRVIRVVDEPTRRGFAYGTLPGHPESGEESFVVVLDPDGTVRLEVVAFSRPGTRLARAVGPAGRAVQELMTRRYLSALRLRRTVSGPR